MNPVIGALGWNVFDPNEVDRKYSVGGNAQSDARLEFESQERDRRVRAVLQEAWQRVLGDPDSLLRDELADTVEEISGHRPDQGTIANFLQGMLGNAGGRGVAPVVQTAQSVAGKPAPTPEGRSVAVDDDGLQLIQRDTLPIELDPSPQTVFLKELLRTKRAWIVELYRDGGYKVRPWEATKMSASSSVVGNLRSRPHNRAGKWQRLGLVSLRVSIQKSHQFGHAPVGCPKA